MSRKSDVFTILSDLTINIYGLDTKKYDEYMYIRSKLLSQATDDIMEVFQKDYDESL